MTPSLLIRPVLVLTATACLGACGAIDSDPNRFENLARRVADIPVSMDRPGAAPKAAVVRTASDMGMRSASAPLRVEVMDPHDLWDARDGGVEKAVANRVAEAAAPMVVDAVVREVSTRVAPQRESDRMGLRPARAAVPGKLVQLGAFGSEAAAREAWGKLSREAALSALTPVYEAVEVNGRRLVRLKVSAPAGAAAAVCAAARINDPWCRRGA